ncbi:hypothetical protein AB6N24_03655 [Cellulomonas sp. 179-A 4D5 NHS]|uniref:hypothetical protein n=1 Tax=Cellulomonas sp. 179-A 4D5 NHS TaxID=3142378 RepID=UPI0039A15751
MSESRNSWGGLSGELFADMILERLAGEGFAGEVEVMPWSELEGGFSVTVRSPEPGVLCWVVDWVDGVRILDPNADDLTVAQAMEYICLRSHGHTAKEASKAVRHRPR